MTATKWCTDDGAAPAWIDIDLGGHYHITDVTIAHATGEEAPTPAFVMARYVRVLVDRKAGK